MIKSVEISNFKCFNNIYLRDLKRINIIGGTNSVGKTALLEALFIFYDRANASNIMRQLEWRGISELRLSAENIYSPLFNDYDLSKQVLITIRDQLKTSSLQIKYNSEGSVPTPPPSIPLVSNIVSSSTSKGNVITDMLEFCFEESGKQKKVHKLLLSDNGPVMFNEGSDKVDKIAGFIATSNRKNMQEGARFYSEIDINKDTEEIIKFLSLINPKIKDISVIYENQTPKIYVDIGMNKKIPIELLGDGVSRLLYLILSIANKKNGLLIIDEIENGFHYSILDEIWKMLFKTAEKYNCQLFVSTHSYELLQSLVLSVEDDFKDHCSYYRLEKKNDDKIYAEKYDFKMLARTITNNWEIR